MQANYATGPISLALSWNDGFYSDQFTWLSGSATWKFDPANSFTAVWAANTQTTTVSTSATPLLQNNSQIYDAIYTYKSGSWTFSPALQYTSVPAAPSIGVPHEGATFGAAVLVNYSFDSSCRIGALNLTGFSLPFRAEFISSTGSASEGAPNLLYGPGSAAWSLTVTPTYQFKTFFARAEASYVGVSHLTTGSAFGPNGSNGRQARFLMETGFLF